MRSFLTTPIFDKTLSKLDSAIQKQILKKMQKIVEMPELGKPLHASLANHFSERVWKYRIIYTFTPERVCFVYLGHRDVVYRNPL